MPDYRVTVTLLTSAEAPGEAGHKALTLLSSARQKEAGESDSSGATYTGCRMPRPKWWSCAMS